jgi:hypothetical protein
MTHRFVQWIFTQFSKWLEKEEPAKHTWLCDFTRINYEVRQADVLLVEGQRRVSRIISRVTLSPWTHSALYIGRLYDIENKALRTLIQQHYRYDPSQQLIIESMLGKGTIISPLEKYRRDHLRICRPMDLSPEDAQQVIAYAIGRLGSHYSMRHIFDLFRFLFPWGLWPRRWRSSLFQHNALQPTEDICSSMIASAFATVGFPILPLIIREKNKIELVQRNPRLFTPSDFDYSPYFDVVKYPIYPPGIFSYKNLPWKEGYISEDDKHILRLPPKKPN